MMSRILIFALKAYKKLLSPILCRFGVQCRFYPYCSDYAVMAIKEFGWKKGLIKTFDRLRRCNPYNLESCIDFPSEKFKLKK